MFRTVQKKLKCSVGFWKALTAWTFFFSRLTQSPGPPLGTVSVAFKKNFLWTRRTRSDPQRKSIQQYQLKLLPLQKGQADTRSAEETNISSIDKCLIGHVEYLMSCMQMQMFEGLFTVQLVPDRLQCQASTQPPIILLGSASKDVSGLSGPCKFPQPKAPLCFQSWCLLSPVSRLSFPCQSLLLPALVQKRLWRNDLRGHYSTSEKCRVEVLVVLLNSQKGNVTL